MQGERGTGRARSRWRGGKQQGAGGQERPEILYAAARGEPMEPPPRLAPGEETELGPYEVRYDISHGYGMERTIIQP